MRLMIELKIGVDAEVPPSCATISVSAGVDVRGANLAILLWNAGTWNASSLSASLGTREIR